MLSATKDEASKLAATAKRDAWDNASEAKHDLEDVAHRAGRKVRGYIDSASEEFSHATENVTTRIRGNPVQSTVIALAAGFVLGKIFRF